MDIEQEIDASYEETLRLLAEIIDTKSVQVHVDPDFLRALADELESLRIRDDEAKATIATLEQYTWYQ